MSMYYTLYYLDIITLHISNIDGLSLFTNGDFGII